MTPLVAVESGVDRIGDQSGDSRRRLPRSLTTALVVGLLASGIMGAVDVGGFSSLPTTVLLDVWIVALIALCLRRTTQPGLLYLTGGYLVVRVVLGLFGDAPTYDLLQAYRWTLYLVAIVAVVGKRWGSPARLRRASLVLIGLAAVKSAAAFAIYGPGTRPGLFVENNFEIALFCGLVVVHYREFTAVQRQAAVAMTSLLVVLSGSRSGIVALVLLLGFVLAEMPWSRATKGVAAIYALPAMAYLSIAVFRSRQTATRIDRLNFLDVFRSEVDRFGAGEWLVGTYPITPLAPRSCAALSYYESLFSSAGDGTCYSVILHSFVMRVVFDAGLLGLTLSIAVPWIAMRRAGVRIPVAVTLIGIAVTNGLSVSGINNPYVALPMLLAVLLAGGRDKARVGRVTIRRPRRRYWTFQTAGR